jgi:hypothetical protein
LALGDFSISLTNGSLYHVFPLIQLFVSTLSSPLFLVFLTLAKIFLGSDILLSLALAVTVEQLIFSDNSLTVIFFQLSKV